MQWIRNARAVLVAGVAGLVCIFTLSDSVLRPLSRAGSAAFRLLGRFEAGVGFDLVSRRDIPFEADTIVHFLAWAAIGLAAGGLATTVADRVNLFIGLFIFSALLEVGQQYLSWSRSAELTDLVANGAGLVVGFACFAVVAAILAHTMSRPSAGI